MYRFSIDIADWKGPAFRRVLASADRFSERAIRRGSSDVNTPGSRSSASLRSATCRDHVRDRTLCVTVSATVRLAARERRGCVRGRGLFAAARLRVGRDDGSVCERECHFMATCMCWVAT